MSTLKQLLTRCVLILCTATYATSDGHSKNVNVPVCAVFYNSDRWSTGSTGSTTISTTSPGSCDCDGNELFVVQSFVGGLALDASEPTQIRLQHFTGYPQQLWKFERAGKPGVYYIISNHTGTALDADKDGEPLKTVLLREKNGSLTQKWATDFNGRFKNVGTDLFLDVSLGSYVPGAVLNVWEENGNKAQQFTLQQKNE